MGVYRSYMAMCLSNHVPQNINIVIVEYNVNDGGAKGDAPVRRAHERLLRRLLAYVLVCDVGLGLTSCKRGIVLTSFTCRLPNRPLVMELVVFRWPGEGEL